ncbi:MAG: hypothetical protein Q4G24_13855 [Paracoccus sp. (in: a-proteobacteria)]|uniref:hypothetical protein n=1 Tax=Paracoccus sp. TaxID=267 RepID=UPI0026DF7262|nr:hypothetical protein [Paracoccus sp. (in: a-proteobacteria)]MDO5622543.1 hypothetical protein [Paracoccus sp. (in: a-proteobacteria)]
MTKADAPASAEEKRALTRDELELADQARQPALGALSDRDLSDLISRLRDRRNRARDIGDRQSRADQGNAGTRSKHAYLNEALDRARSERDSRGVEADAEDAEDQKVNPMMETGGPLHPHDPDADKGKKAMAETHLRQAPSGALDHSGELASRKRSGGAR